MKFFHLGICLALCVSPESKELRQISRLIPIEDWIEFKNRTQDVKPLDKFIGKLRSTYDFVFQKSENVSNVGKILNNVHEDFRNTGTKMDAIEYGERTSQVKILNAAMKESNISDILKGTDKKISNDRIHNEEVGEFEKIKNLQDPLILERLEILDDDDTSSTFDNEDENFDEKIAPNHTNFSIPYAIIQAIFRWLISLYYSGHHARTDIANSESA